MQCCAREGCRDRAGKYSGCTRGGGCLALECKYSDCTREMLYTFKLFINKLSDQ